MGAIDAFIAYKFIKILSTPFDQTDLNLVSSMLTARYSRKEKILEGLPKRKPIPSFIKLVGT